jgi:hypothetical protein
MYLLFSVLSFSLAPPQDLRDTCKLGTMWELTLPGQSLNNGR